MKFFVFLVIFGQIHEVGALGPIIFVPMFPPFGIVCSRTDRCLPVLPVSTGTDYSAEVYQDGSSIKIVNRVDRLGPTK